MITEVGSVVGGNSDVRKHKADILTGAIATRCRAPASLADPKVTVN